MIIGIPKEIKVHEYRVGATPTMVRHLVSHGHQLKVQSGAGEKIGFNDKEYRLSGASILSSATEVYKSEMIIKIKEPQESEFPLLHHGQILFCYLHLAADPTQAAHLLDRKVIGIAYETVVDDQKKLPLLIPMSEIAGRLSIHVGAAALQMNHGGKGILLGGVPGVSSGNVVIIGGGIAGAEAARIALGIGANVTVLDKDIWRLRHLEDLFGPSLRTLYSTHSSIEEIVPQADLLIGAVLIPGKIAPKLVSKELVKKMMHGSVIVDIAIDQGGCVETAKPTTHENPTYVVDGIVHYCVTNMPAACAKTATLALTQATMERALLIADNGYLKAIKIDPGLREGVNVCLGNVTNESIASDLGYPYVSILEEKSDR